MSSAVEALRPLVIAVVVFSGLAGWRMLRRGLRQDRPAVALAFGLVTTAGYALSLGDAGLGWGVGAILAGFFFSHVPVGTDRAAAVARLRGRHARAARLALASYVVQPTARHWVLLRAARVVAQVAKKRQSAEPAIDALRPLLEVCGKLPDPIPTLVLWHARFRILALAGETDRIVTELHDEAPERLAHPVLAGGVSVGVEVLAQRGHAERALALTEALGLVQARGALSQTEYEAHVDRARVWALAASGDGAGVLEALAPSSTIAPFFPVEERAQLIALAQRLPVSERASTVRQQLDRAIRLPNDLVQLRALSPWTRLLVLVLCAVHGLTLLTGSSFDPEHLLWLGACQSDLVRGGETWRLVTSVFLHAGPHHLLMNAFFLVTLGNLLERLGSRPLLLAVFLVAGLAGAGTHVAFDQTSTPLVGASGAIFGVFGAALVVLFARRAELPVGWFRRLRQVMVLTLVLNLALSVAVSFVSLSAHSGGFVAGAAVAALWMRSPGVPRVRESRAVLLVGVAWALALAFTVVPLWRSLRAGPAAVIPMHTETLRIDGAMGRASLRLDRPVTWRVLPAGEGDPIGPTWAGPSADLLRVVVRCGAPEDIGLEDGATESRRSKDGGGDIVQKVRVFPNGAVVLAFGLSDDRRAVGERLIARVLASVVLSSCVGLPSLDDD